MAFCVFKASPVRDPVVVKNFANCFQQTRFTFPLAVSASVKDRHGAPAAHLRHWLPVQRVESSLDPLDLGVDIFEICNICNICKFTNCH